ncbi:unnamed protein product [Moneuplotes crassus]|uniref:Uncharacterized protein n=1 Tax=Euplotes crassus TaxID=5936 RepID=A0AAD1X891_EUPCR|nr:unnamed protein product [Moneuplotes crassus]
MENEEHSKADQNSPGKVSQPTQEAQDLQIFEKYESMSKAMLKNQPKSPVNQISFGNLMDENKSEPNKTRSIDNTYIGKIYDLKSLRKERKIKQNNTNENKKKRKNNTKLSQFLSPIAKSPQKVDFGTSASFRALAESSKKENQRYKQDDSPKKETPEADNAKWEEKLRITVDKYETMLRSINQGFKDLMLTNENLELQLQLSKRVQTRTNEPGESVEVIKQAFMKQQLEHDSAQERLQMEHQKFQSEKEELLLKLHTSNSKIALLEREMNDHEQLNQSHDALKRNYTSQENLYKTENMNLRIKVDELASKLAELERTSKQKEEALFDLSRELETCKNSLNNYEHSESQYKREVMNLVQDKNELENQIQDYQMSIKVLETSSSQASDRLMVLQRENEMLQNSLTYSKQNDQRILKDLQMYKSRLASAEERNKTLDMDMLRLQQKIKYLQDENTHLQRMLEETGDESEETHMIRQKEMELQQLIQQHKIRKASKEREGKFRDSQIYSPPIYQPNASQTHLPKDTRPDHQGVLDSLTPASLNVSFLSAKPDANIPQVVSLPNQKVQEATSFEIAKDDPFWKNRDIIQREMNIKKEGIMKDFLQNSAQRGRRKERIDPSKMEPAGKKSLERPTSLKFQG